MTTETAGSAFLELPSDLAWDIPAEPNLDASHRGFVIDRILARGSLGQIRGLRRTVGDAALEERLREKHGRGLDRRRLRFLELVLLLPRSVVDDWLSDPRRKLWDGR